MAYSKPLRPHASKMPHASAPCSLAWHAGPPNQQPPPGKGPPGSVLPPLLTFCKHAAPAGLCQLQRSRTPEPGPARVLSAFRPRDPPCLWGSAGGNLPPGLPRLTLHPGRVRPVHPEPPAPAPFSRVGPRPRPGEDAQAIFSRNKWREIALPGEQPLLRANFHIIESNDVPSFPPVPPRDLTNGKSDLIQGLPRRGRS